MNFVDYDLNVSDPWIRNLINNNNNNTDDSTKTTRTPRSSSQWRSNSSEQNSTDQIVDVSYLYPILQKISENESEQQSNDDSNNSNTNTNNNSNNNNNNSNNNNSNNNSNSTPNTKPKTKKKKSNFVSWNTSPALIKFTFYGDNPLGSFLDNAWGSIQIPVRELVDKQVVNENKEPMGIQPEVRLWKDIVWTSAYVQVSLLI